MKRAFTLIELMIVILIMGVVYTLVVENFKTINNKADKLSLKSLKGFLQSYPHKRSVRLLCLDNCKNCFLEVDDKKQDVKIKNFLDNTVAIYRYDFDYGLTQKENETYFNQDDVEEDVCFSYEIDENGVGDQVLIKYKNNVYDLSSYFPPVVVYPTLEEAVNAKQNLAMKIVQ